MQTEKLAAGGRTEDGEVPYEVQVSAGKNGLVTVEQAGRNMCLAACNWRSLWNGWEENQGSGFVIVVSAHFHSDYLCYQYSGKEI